MNGEKWSQQLSKCRYQFPAQKCRTEKKVPHEAVLLCNSVHGCRIATDLADTTCTSQLRATPRCDFSRIAAGKTIFFVPCAGTTTSRSIVTDNSVEQRAWRAPRTLS